MEERILVYKDEAEIRSGKGFFEAVKINMQSLVDFLLENEVEVTHTMVVNLINNNGSSKGIFQERERIMLKDIPKILRSSANTGTAENIKACNEIIEKANRLLTCSDNARFIDFSKWVIKDNKVIITEEAFKDFEDSCSIFIDTPNRKKIYEKAVAVKEALEELNQLVSNAPQRGLGDGLKVKGIDISGDFAFGILEVDRDGFAGLIGQHFGYIQ